LYVADIQRPHTLFGTAVRSPYAHALVKEIDPSEALSWPGVVAVFTAADIPGKNLTGPRTVKDQPVLTDHVRFPEKRWPWWQRRVRLLPLKPLRG